MKAKEPKAANKRLKLFLFGPMNSGKTTSALQFPKAVLIDMERGTDHYEKTIKKSRSVVLQTTSPDDVISEVKDLLTEKHDYRTLIIDPITIFYQAVQDKWSRVFEKYAKTEKEAALQDFGMRYWGRVKSEYKALLRMLFQLDMNVIVTAHQKDIYGPGMQRLDVGADSMKGDTHAFDYVFQLSIENGKCVAVTKKQRSEPLEPAKFPPQFEWSYENFCNFYGREVIERESSPVVMASVEQVAEIKRLVELVNVPPETVTSWFTKADVDAFEEMNAETIEKCIQFVKKKLEPVKTGK